MSSRNRKNLENCSIQRLKNYYVNLGCCRRNNSVASDLIEGGQNIYYGANGDLRSTAYNPLRDTVFMGNQEIYDNTKNVFAFTASAMCPIGKAYGELGKLSFRTVGTIVGEEIISDQAGNFANMAVTEIGKHFDWNPYFTQTLAMGTGIWASNKMSNGLVGLDKKFNISGNFPSYKISQNSNTGFKYEHNPSDNPKVLQDAIEDPKAVYGYSPNPESNSIGGYATKIDWSDPMAVNGAAKRRIDYHVNNDNISELIIKMKSEECSVEDIAKAANEQRNLNRLNDYINDVDGLKLVKERNLVKYGNENGPTAEFLYNKYGSWETVIEKTMSANPGMDACCGLYDKYFHLYDLN